MKKAQIIGQVFIFILAAALFILILMYGYRAVKTLLERQEEVALLTFKVDLESAVDRIKLSFGSVERVEVRVPKKHKELCIIDPQTCGGSAIEAYNPQMYRACIVGGENKENVFLVPKQKVEVRLKDIEVPGSYCCIKIEGKGSLRFEGKGNKASIKNWPGQEITSCP